MSRTHGLPHQARHFDWRFDMVARELLISNENHLEHAYRAGEIWAILNRLNAQFGRDWFPLANNVELLRHRQEQPGLGMTILEQKPGDVHHAQGASYLGVVLEECGYLDWNGQHRGITWRLVGDVPSLTNLEACLADYSKPARRT